MSYDNAEHRNNVNNNVNNNNNNNNNTNTIRRIPNAMDLRRLLRKCSYCRETGHNISNCNHHSLIQFDSICLFKKSEINDPLRFAHWLGLTSIESINGNTLVKAYGISKHGCILRDNMHVIIEKITNKLYNLVENIDEDYVRLPEMENSSATSIFNQMISFNLMTSLLLSPRSVAAAQIHPEEEIVIKLIYDETVHKNVDSIECSICYETKNAAEMVQLNCNHSFCKCCTKQVVETKPSCPYCRTKIDKISFNTIDVYKFYVGEHNYNECL